jgi:hypothetical protein
MLFSTELDQPTRPDTPTRSANQPLVPRVLSLDQAHPLVAHCRFFPNPRRHLCLDHDRRLLYDVTVKGGNMWPIRGHAYVVLVSFSPAGLFIDSDAHDTL